MAERTAFVGEPLLLNLRLASEVAGRFPQVTIRDSSGTTVAGPLNMTDQGGGLYQAIWVSPVLGQYEAGYLTYTDAGHTTRSIDEPASDDIFVSDAAADVADIADAVWEEAAADHVTDGTMGVLQVAAGGHAGANSVLDGGAGVPNIPHNSNNNLTSARLRIFANKAAADAATLGAADGADGEIIRLNFDVANYTNGTTTAVPEILINALRTLQ